MTSGADDHRARAAAEAAEWAQRFALGNLSNAERRQFVEWLRTSPLHVAEMLWTDRLGTALGSFDAWDRSVAPPTPVEPNVVALGDCRAVPHPPPNPRRLWPRLASAAASLLLATMAAWMLSERMSVLTVHTQPGERRELTLADGSVVRLLPQTDLRIRLQAHLRSVQIAHGEAMFRVAKDHARPFVVDAGSARVQAVGTMFSVERADETVVITVQEGRVEVQAARVPGGDSAGSASAPFVPLKANERLSVSPRGIPGAILHIERREGRAPFEWGDKQLTFDNMRITDVVARFNQRNRLQIRLLDPALGARTVSGIFDVDDPESFVEFLESMAGASSSHGDQEIMVGAGTPVQGSDAQNH
jgi:transmembrane sensor